MNCAYVVGVVSVVGSGLVAGVGGLLVVTVGLLGGMTGAGNVTLGISGTLGGGAAGAGFDEVRGSLFESGC